MGSMKGLIWNGLYQATKQCFKVRKQKERKGKPVKEGANNKFK